eukprot:4317701-Ditylum_brightwellii.AAC.1
MYSSNAYNLWKCQGKLSATASCHRAYKQKQEYINDKVGCDSSDDTEKVMREDNGVEMVENAEKENNNEKEPESEEEEEKNEGFE